MNKSITVRVLYSQGCPNALPVLDLIERVGKDIDIPVVVESIMVTSPEKAAELRCLGSPTVQINGVDIDPEARESRLFGLG